MRKQYEAFKSSTYLEFKVKVRNRMVCLPPETMETWKMTPTRPMHLSRPSTCLPPRFPRIEYPSPQAPGLRGYFRANRPSLASLASRQVRKRVASRSVSRRSPRCCCASCITRSPSETKTRATTLRSSPWTGIWLFYRKPRSQRRPTARRTTSWRICCGASPMESTKTGRRFLTRRSKRRSPPPRLALRLAKWFSEISQRISTRTTSWVRRL